MLCYFFIQNSVYSTGEKETEEEGRQLEGRGIMKAVERNVRRKKGIGRKRIKEREKEEGNWKAEDERE